MSTVNLIECPRDAMQGFSKQIPTITKIEYMNALLKVGFHTLDCGSFVNPAAIPQMADTMAVIPNLNLEDTETKLSVVVGNKRGAEDAAQFDEITYVGYPFSISETFQIRNTNCNFEESLNRVDEIMNICECHGKKFVLYVSMAFGNPYGDVYDPVLVSHWVDRLSNEGVIRFSVSDTIGIAKPDLITEVLGMLYEDFSHVGIGSHFHTTPDTWEEKLVAAYEAGCRRFDGAIKGFGGCPMAKDDLTGNMPTEKMLDYFTQKGIVTNINQDAFAEAMAMASKVFA